MTTTALLIGICIPLVSILVGLFIARCISPSDDCEDDVTRARQIIEASEPMPLEGQAYIDHQYIHREVRRVRAGA